MSDPDEKLTQISREQRTLLQIVSVLLIVAGGILFLSWFFAVASGMGRLSGSFEEEGQRMAGAFLRAVVGLVLLGVGSFLARFAFLKPVSEIVATETAGAVTHSASAVGRGLASSGVLSGAA
jgi:hypothetical protein